MKIEISHTSLIFEFVNDGFDSRKIYESLLHIIDDIITSNNLKIPDDWMLIFDIGYNNGRIPLLSKNKFGTYPSDKMKYIKFHVKLEDTVSEGVIGVNDDASDEDIDNFFEKWGIKLNGTIKWKGENMNDIGKIVVENNKVTVIEFEF